jgi:glycosyltransferase involved in cell wall biosynthesis
MMTGRPRLVFVRPGPHPFANSSLAQALVTGFPDYDVEVVDVIDRLRLQRGRVARAAVAAIRDYGFDIAAGRRGAKDALLRTPAAFSALRDAALEGIEALGGPAPSMTLQIQSLFDAHLSNVPHFVYTDHTHLANLSYPSFDPKQLLRASWIDRERTIYQHATLCFVRSRHIAESLQRDYLIDEARVECVYAGANTEALERPPADPASSQRIVFVGVDWRRKGGPTLVRAFERVRKEFPLATLQIIGCSPDAVTGMEIAGRVPLAEVAQRLATGGIFCLPTMVEPFGVAFLEAMTQGLPIVGTSVGAVPDMVTPGDNGFLVTPGDVEGLASALRMLLADPELRRTAGLRSMAIVAERYTWPAVVARMRAAMTAVARDVR